MKWVSHIAIGGATCAVAAPHLVPLAVLGATAPDWLEWVIKAAGGHITHRGATHYAVFWLVFFVATFAGLDYNGLLAAFAWGGVTHIFTDAMTITGVPFSPLSDRRFHFFGGRLRTGAPAEYFIAAAVLMVCAALAWTLHRNDSDFMPYFYDWGGYYDEGLIDAAEWKKNRFKLF